MDDQVIWLQPGARPWEPSPSAELVATYHEYDVPLVGVFRQFGVPYIFDCLFGDGRGLSLWAYRRLTNEGMSALDHSHGDDRLRQADALLLQGLVTVALAHEDRGVSPVSVQVAVRGDRSLLIHDAVEALEEYARSIQSDTEDLAAASG